MGRVLKQVSKISGVYGQPGEEKVSRFLAENLPDHYAILNSPRIYYHGATFDIDHVVIGPNGIFVIETKNMQGLIMGGMMGNWVQERKRSGKHRRVKIGNPANQVNQYGKVVKSQLGSRLAYDTGRKETFKIYPIVVFVNEDADLSGLDFTKTGYIGRVRVIPMEKLADFILHREGAVYPPEDTELFARLLVPENQRDQTVYFSQEQLREYTESKSDRYEIFEELGRGSFGIVYRGFDYKLDREVAIKKLPLQNQSSPGVVSSFYREAQVASGLNHDNIVGVYDYYEEAGEYFIVMEMVEGCTLQEYVKNHRPSIHETLEIISSVCHALEYAHNNQVIHRDLKPANILVSNDGDIKVTDFGIAKVLDASDVTMAGGQVGTPISMSPEQVTGGEVTEKSDVFAIGVLLYNLLTGLMPFDAEHPGAIINKIMRAEPMPPGRLNPAVSADLDALVYKTLEKNPGDRFADVRSLAAAVDEIKNTGRLSVPISKKTWLRYIPVFLRPVFRSERRLFAAITITSLLLFIAILGFQGYRDSRQISQEAVLTKQYGFSNENISLLFENPRLYMGLPVNFVGRVDKIIHNSENSTQFSVAINSNDPLDQRNIIVQYNSVFPGQSVSYLNISGSIQNVTKTTENSQTPVVIADKVEPIADPWSILAPSQFTVYPNKAIKQNGKVVELEKVEFAQQETRLFIRIRNQSDYSDIVVVSNPVARQGSKEFSELSDGYRSSLPPTIQLQPAQEARGVAFMEPLNRQLNQATIVLGSANDILMGQEPYVFDIKW